MRKPTLRTYKNFRGVDFSSDEAQVDISRSPNAINIWKDYGAKLGQAIETRPGFRIIKDFDGHNVLEHKYNSIIIKIHTFYSKGVNYFLVHVKEFDVTKSCYIGKLYQWQNYGEEPAEYVLLKNDIGTENSVGFVFDEKYYFLDGKNYYCIEKSSTLGCYLVSDNAFVPTTYIIGADGISTEYQGFNMLTGKQKNQFVTVKDQTEYYIIPQYTERSVNDVRVTVNNEKISLEDFTYEDLDEDDKPIHKLTLTNGSSNDNDTMVVSFEQAFDRALTKEMFQRGIDITPSGEIEFDISESWRVDLHPRYGEDVDEIEIVNIYCDDIPYYTWELVKYGNVLFIDNEHKLSEPQIIFVEYHEIMKESNHLKPEPVKCDKVAVYDNRVFFANCPTAKTKYFWTALNNPTYIPYLNYETAGNEELDVSAFIIMSDGLAMIKKGEGQNGYIYNIQRLITNDASLPVAYTKSLVASSIGGYGQGINFLNDIVFMSRRGLKAIAKLDIHNERNIEHRSTTVDSKLINELDIDNSTMCVFKGYLFILVNGRCYLADSRQVYSSNVTQSIEYEWYFWDNIGVYENGRFYKATTMTEFDGKLFFGTENGAVCQFNTDMLKTTSDGDNPLGTGELLATAYQDDSLVTNDGGDGLDVKGIAISSCWTTPFDDFGNRNHVKRCNKRGAMADLKSYTHSIAKVAISTNNYGMRDLKRHNGGMFDFSELDYEDFTFNTSDRNVVYFEPRDKKWERISLMFYTDEICKPFGIYGATIEAYIMGYAKERR